MSSRKCGLGVLIGQDAQLLTHVYCVTKHMARACSDTAKDTPFQVI